MITFKINVHGIFSHLGKRKGQSMGVPGKNTNNQASLHMNCDFLLLFYILGQPAHDDLT